MIKHVMLVLTVVLVLLQYRLWFSHDSFPAFLHLHRQVSTQRLENNKLIERNDILSAEVSDLKSGMAAIEGRARSQMGMIKPGETFFQIIEKNDAKK